MINKTAKKEFAADGRQWRDHVIDFLNNNDGDHSTRDVIRGIGRRCSAKNSNSVGCLLAKMVGQGLIKRVSYGVYTRIA